MSSPSCRQSPAGSPCARGWQRYPDFAAACQDDEDFGRTSLQKVSYFVGEALGHNVGHRPYHYGPFSERLETDLSLLVDAGLVLERTEVMGHATPAAPSGSTTTRSPRADVPA